MKQSVRMSARLIAICSAGALALAACSEGGGSTTPPRTTTPTTPPPTSGPTWTQNSFQPSSTFEARCENPRSGVDLEGTPFPDRSGSLLEELFWLRSWTHETYLWNNEVVDRDPAGFNNRLAYFDVLKTDAVTPSGAPKDQFHFSEPTEQYLADVLSAPSAGYGARFIDVQEGDGLDVRVAYVDPNTPAAEVVGGSAQLRRGDTIVSVDGVNVVGANSNAEIDTIFDGLFPINAGETHTFQVRNAAGVLRTVMITAADVSRVPVNFTDIISTPTGDVGYIVFNTFSPFASEQAIVNAITAMQTAGVTDLILDLRYNGGGLLAVAAQLSYMVAGDAATDGKTFELLQFNADAGNINPITNQVNQPFPFVDIGVGFTVPENTPLPTLTLPRVFILTTDRTCSASESVINGLRGIDIEVVLIGTKTCGKPYGFYPTDNCGETYYTIQFQGTNDKGFGDYADGFIANNSNESFGVRAPGCAANDDLTREFGDPAEGLLAAALQYRATGACPTPPPASVSPSGISQRSIIERGLDDFDRNRSVMDANRDLTGLQ